jgi:hypothetical protein
MSIRSEHACMHENSELTTLVAALLCNQTFHMLQVLPSIQCKETKRNLSTISPALS